MNDVNLACIEYQKEPIHTWDFVELKDYTVRVYYSPYAERERSGFMFYAVENIGHEVGKDIWDVETCLVECVVNGLAYFDGIRHLYYGDIVTQNDGYHYYPSIDMIIAVLQAVSVLEMKFCNK